MKFRLAASLAGILLLISSAASAQVDTDPGVARVSLIHGDISTQRGDSGDWAAATLNQPIVAGDRVAVGDSSRSEVQLDFANILRLDSRTQANVTALSRTQIQIQLARGLANYSVVKDSEADVEIDAPNLSVHPRRGDGSYRINVISDDQAEVLVRKGEADISTPQGSTHVRSGQMITVRGTGNDTQYQVSDAPSKDDFDRWANDRDNTIRNAQSWGRTNQYYVGSEDLDAYGRWSNVPDYGQVWVPAVASGWAPYRAGRWVWQPYWGWTWVSYEPWGWAPYHYGRWFLYGSSWVWWPGQSYGYRHYRPVWAPAYVSFFGFGRGGGFGVSFGSGWGSVGWLPIGPCDRFYPWYGGYRSRFNTVNVTNITNVTNIYNNNHGGIPPLRTGTQYSNVRLALQNDRMRQAVSTVSANDFGRGRITARPVSRESLLEGKMVAGNLPVVPSRDSLLSGERRATPPAVARGPQQERFFSPNNRTVAKPQSFDREAADVRSAIQRDGKLTPIGGNERSTTGEGNPRSVSQGRTGENTGGKPAAGLPVNGSNPGSNPSSNSGSNQGSNQSWRRSGQTERPSNMGGTPTTTTPGQRMPAGGDNSDWRRGRTTTAPQAPTGNGSSNNGNPTGRVNTPADRRAPATSPAPQGNQEWRRFDRSSDRSSDRPSDSAPRSMSGSTEAPASRDRVQREDSSPSQDRGNDWRRMTPTQQSTSSGADNRSSAPPAQRDSGNWRQSAPRDSGREASRPALDMRQPIVTPRSAGPAPSGGGGGYRGNGGGGGGGRSAPSGGGGQSAPNRGGGGHSGGNGGHSGGSGTPHRGR